MTMGMTMHYAGMEEDLVSLSVYQMADIYRMQRHREHINEPDGYTTIIPLLFRCFLLLLFRTSRSIAREFMIWSIRYGDDLYVFVSARVVFMSSLCMAWLGIVP